MNNWNARDITIDFSFLGAEILNAEIFEDGINANRDATDYKKESGQINFSKKLSIHLAPGGGMAMRIAKQQ